MGGPKPYEEPSTPETKVEETIVTEAPAPEQPDDTTPLDEDHPE